MKTTFLIEFSHALVNFESLSMFVRVMTTLKESPVCFRLPTSISWKLMTIRITIRNALISIMTTVGGGARLSGGGVVFAIAQVALQ